MFPNFCPIIPGLATSRQTISLHRIYYNNETGKFSQDLVKQYRILSDDGRLNFIVDIFKIAIWIVSQNYHPQQSSFHLVSGVRLRTRNNHHVTLGPSGILKEFSPREGREISMETIRAIYDAKLPNVEQGVANLTSVTITTVGRRLRDVYGPENNRSMTPDLVLTQVREAVRQLHRIGVAHCNICVENIFVNLDDDVVFLGDLEYCQPMDDPPPTDFSRSDPRAHTGKDLDLIQLDKFQDELATILDLNESI